jgi:hypothetical protein
MKCCFCDEPLRCKACGADYEPPSARAHEALYEPETAILCPACRRLLVCRSCRFAYGEPTDDDEGADEMDI